MPSKKSQQQDSTASKQKKDHNKEELKRLETSLNDLSKKIEEKKPSEREFFPDVYNDLKPYTETGCAKFALESDKRQREAYRNRSTATGLCDPWVALDMDLKYDAAKSSPRKSGGGSDGGGDKSKKKSKQAEPAKEGSTHLPQHVTYDFDKPELARRDLYFTDIPMLRDELQKNLSIGAEQKIENDYTRTKQDYFRMELYKLDEVHPVNRDNMKRAYYAYLQNTPGSKKAIHECVKETEKQLSAEEQEEEEEEKARKEKEAKEAKEAEKDEQDEQAEEGEEGEGGEKGERADEEGNDRAEQKKEKNDEEEEEKKTRPVDDDGQNEDEQAEKNDAAVEPEENAA